MNDASQHQRFRVPCKGDKATIVGLASAAQHNGKSGTVLKYMQERSRYKVRLVSEDGTNALVSVKGSNFLLQDERKQPIDCQVSMHILVPCHLNDVRRVYQFLECAKSLAHQDCHCRVFISISGKQKFQEAAMEIIRQIVAKPSPLNRNFVWYAVTNEGCQAKAQFEHLKDLLDLSESIDPHAWLLFLDNDDMYLPERTGFFQRTAIERHSDPSFEAFYSGGKLLIDSKKTGEDVIALEKILTCDKSLDGLVQVAGTLEENSILDVIEYFDFCVRSCFLRKFFDLTPSEMLCNSYCDVRFMVSISRVCTLAVRHSELEWLLMHYRVRHDDRYQAFLEEEGDEDKDEEKRYSNAMMRLNISEADEELSSESGASAYRIAVWRKEMEERVIQFVARDEENLESAKVCLVRRMNNNLGNEIGARLWDQVVTKFSSYFSDELAARNKQWCKDGKAPYVVFSEETDGPAENYY